MFEFILLTLLGLLFGLIGYRLWKKEQISLLHDYHYKHVAENDKKPYTEAMGKACLLIGLGMVLTGLIDMATGTAYGWLCFALCFILAFIKIIKAQYKYNGGFF